jgi:hypothetical protein
VGWRDDLLYVPGRLRKGPVASGRNFVRTGSRARHLPGVPSLLVADPGRLQRQGWGKVLGPARRGCGAGQIRFSQGFARHNQCVQVQNPYANLFPFLSQAPQVKRHRDGEPSAAGATCKQRDRAPFEKQSMEIKKSNRRGATSTSAYPSPTDTVPAAVGTVALCQ